MAGDTDKSGDWLRVRLQPAETIMAGIVAILWIAWIGGLIAADRIIGLVSAAFGVEPYGLTAFVGSVGSITSRYWLISFPLWAVAVAGSFLWALSMPEERQSRLVLLAFALVMLLFAVLLATYVPFAQAAAAIATPHPGASAPGP